MHDPLKTITKENTEKKDLTTKVNERYHKGTQRKNKVALRSALEKIALRKSEYRSVKKTGMFEER